MWFILKVPDLIPDIGGGGLAVGCEFSSLDDFMEDDFNQATRGDPLLSSSHASGNQTHMISHFETHPDDHHHHHQGETDLSRDRNYQPSEEDESLSPESLDRMELSAWLTMAIENLFLDQYLKKKKKK